MDTLYHIKYWTGAGDFTYKGTLQGAMKAAEKEVQYTQQPVEIYQDGNEIYPVAVLNWNGYPADEDDEVVVDYGKFGFYGPWEIFPSK